MTDSRRHGASRGKAIVDDNYRFAVKIERRAACAIEVFAPPHLSLFACDGVLDILIGNSQLPNHLVIQNPRPARDRPYGEFRLPGNAKLANDDNLQRNTQSIRYRESHQDTPAR
jgi:hypothetical protein